MLQSVERKSTNKFINQQNLFASSIQATPGAKKLPYNAQIDDNIQEEMETMKRQLSTVMRQYTERSRRPVTEQISPVHPVGSCGHRTSTTSLFKTLRRKRRRFIRKRSNKT